jgi:uncharacterized protein (TIGR02271 family)
MASKNTNPNKKDSNPDPITGAPGSHPIGTGIGAAGGGAAGAAAGAAIGAAMSGPAAPIGGAVGAVVGAIAGGLAGKGVAEQIDPTTEDAYWRENHRARPYYEAGRDYDYYQPAYRYGWESRSRHAGKDFASTEPELRAGWEREHGKTGFAWEHARSAVRDAWDRVGSDGDGGGTQVEREATVPVVEERLAVGKREVEQGGVRVKTRVEERPVEEQVNLREEHARVERRPVDRPANEADIARAARGQSIEVTEMHEEPVVAKEARVVEEVVVGKEVEQRTETVRDTVRRTDVEVEKVEDRNASQKKSADRR